MTLMDAINEVDNLKPNLYELPEKIKWLSRLDRRIFEDILLTHELSEEEKAPFLPEGSTAEDPEPGLAPWALELPERPPASQREKLVFRGYTEADRDTELIAGEPYDEMYIFWLSAQIDQNNMEILSFNNANAMFEATYSAFRNAFNRSHRPLGAKKIYY